MEPEPEPASLLLIDISARRWDVEPALTSVGGGRLGNDSMTMRDEQPAIPGASAGASLELRVLREMWEGNKCLRSDC